MFMDFLKSLSLFGEKAPPERMKELIGIVEGQADLDAQFNVSEFFFSLNTNKHAYFICDRVWGAVYLGILSLQWLYWDC